MPQDQGTEEIIVNFAKVPVGIFFAYDAKPTIARDVEAIGAKFCIEKSVQGFECAEPELIIHNECPVELSNEVYFQPFEALEDASGGFQN
jgi:hypothetical protein